MGAAHGWEAFERWRKRREALKGRQVSDMPADELVDFAPVPDSVDTKPFSDPGLPFKKGGKRANGNRRLQTPPLANGKAPKMVGSYPFGQASMMYMGSFREGPQSSVPFPAEGGMLMMDRSLTYSGEGCFCSEFIVWHVRLDGQSIMDEM